MAVLPNIQEYERPEPPLQYHGPVELAVEPPKPPEPEVATETIDKPEVVIEKPMAQNSLLCSCVDYVQSKGAKVRGDAADMVPNLFGQEPKGGDLVLLEYNLSHVAYIESTYTNGFTISEANFKRCQYTTRFIPWDDPNIRGYIRTDWQT